MSETLAALPSAAKDLELAKPAERVELIRATLSANEKYIAQALGKFMSAERFSRMVVTLVRGNEDLLKCKPSTVILSVLRIAQLQLSPDPALGQAFLVPRKGKAEFQIGFKGYLALAYRSRRVLAVRYGVVHKDDHFEWRDGKHFTLDHIQGEQGWPALQGETKAAWAIIDLRGGGQLPRVMYLPEILRHKQAGSSTGKVWVENFAAMAVKTVIGDVCRRGPLEEEFGRALSWDEGSQPDDPEIIDVVNVTPADTTTKAGAFVAAFAPPVEPAGADSDDDPLGDALDVDPRQADQWDFVPPGDSIDNGPVPIPVPDHVNRILAAASARGMSVETLHSVAGAPVDASMPASAEHEVLKAVAGWKSPAGGRR